MGDASSEKLKGEALSVIGHHGGYGTRTRNVRTQTKADDAEVRSNRPTFSQ